MSRCHEEACDELLHLLRAHIVLVFSLSLLVMKIALCVALVCAVALVADAAVPSSERSFLITLYNSVGGPNWKIKVLTCYTMQRSQIGRLVE